MKSCFFCDRKEAKWDKSSLIFIHKMFNLNKYSLCDQHAEKIKRWYEEQKQKKALEL